MLRTKDLQATIEFYTWRLGFTCDGMSEVDGWASLRRDAVSLMVATPNAHAPFDAPVFTGSLYFDVDDAVVLWTALKDLAEVCYPLEAFHYGMREFAIYDNNDTCCSSVRPFGPDWLVTSRSLPSPLVPTRDKRRSGFHPWRMPIEIPLATSRELRPAGSA
jgi:catechol 2,3-dioxygenase-like lactoylglutathione lyase family enzyme